MIVGKTKTMSGYYAPVRVLVAAAALCSASTWANDAQTSAANAEPGAQPAVPAQVEAALASGEPAAPAAAPVVKRKVSPFRQEKMTERAREHYEALWGVDRLKVSEVASGSLIRFSYRVADPERAKALNDKKATPYLIGLRNSVILQVPVMDKVGALRQSSSPIAGKEYWMTFSNKGNYVKAGDRVNIVIGSFRADGLAVE